MARPALLWGGALAALLGLATASAALALVASATAEAQVQRYLNALATDDLTEAMRLAGVHDGDGRPLGDDGTPEVATVVDSVVDADGRAEVRAEYGSSSDRVTVTFVLEQDEPTLGFIPNWQFVDAPVAIVAVSADQHGVIRVNDRTVHLPAPGVARELEVLVPSRVTAFVIDPLLTVTSATGRVDGGTRLTLEVRVQPSATLVRAVRGEVEGFVVDCAAQRVLQPTGCPFGFVVTDRVVGAPLWHASNEVEVTISPSGEPGRWRLDATTEVSIDVTVQRLRDGTLRDLSETVPVNIEGQVVLTAQGPRVTIYPPD